MFLCVLYSCVCVGAWMSNKGANQLISEPFQHLSACQLHTSRLQARHSTSVRCHEHSLCIAIQNWDANDVAQLHASSMKPSSHMASHAQASSSPLWLVQKSDIVFCIVTICSPIKLIGLSIGILRCVLDLVACLLQCYKYYSYMFTVVLALLALCLTFSLQIATWLRLAICGLPS